MVARTYPHVALVVARQHSNLATEFWHLFLRVFVCSFTWYQTHQPITQANPEHAAAVKINSNRVARLLMVQLMVFDDMDMHAPRRQMKHTVGGEHEDAPAPIFGKWRSDIARDRAESIEQLDGLRSTVDRDAFDAIVGSRPNCAGRVFEQTANALLVKPCLLADIHCRDCRLPDNSPVVCADP